jgi:hypothetical protein
MEPHHQYLWPPNHLLAQHLPSWRVVQSRTETGHRLPPGHLRGADSTLDARHNIATVAARSPSREGQSALELRERGERVVPAGIEWRSRHIRFSNCISMSVDGVNGTINDWPFSAKYPGGWVQYKPTRGRRLTARPMYRMWSLASLNGYTPGSRSPLPRPACQTQERTSPPAKPLRSTWPASLIPAAPSAMGLMDASNVISVAAPDCHTMGRDSMQVGNYSVRPHNCVRISGCVPQLPANCPRELIEIAEHVNPDRFGKLVIAEAHTGPATTGRQPAASTVSAVSKIAILIVRTGVRARPWIRAARARQRDRAGSHRLLAVASVYRAG